MLKYPIEVEEIGVKVLENINKALTTHLGGDKGTYSIIHIMRVPGTFSFKFENNPKKVEIIHESRERYNLKDFLKLIENTERIEALDDTKNRISTNMVQSIIDSESKSFGNLLISKGNDMSHLSGSELDINIKISLKLGRDK